MVRYTEPFLLSSRGSTRATAYGFSNKSITLDGRTHVVWLDAIAQVCGRTYDHSSGAWSETYRLFEGCDNHTSPTLTADRSAHLRIAYGPHGFWGNWNQGRFKWAISAKPNCLDAWTGEEDFGYSATYACMTHTTHGLDAIVYRGGDSPASLMFQRQREKGGWTSARELMRQNIKPQYTHLNATIACGRDGTVYVAGHFYSEDAGQGRSHGMAVLKSNDLGESWTDLRGEPVSVPALYSGRIAIPLAAADMYVDGIALDSEDALWALAMHPGAGDRAILLSRWRANRWETADLQGCLPPGWVAVDGVLTMDTRDRVHLALAAVDFRRVDDPTPTGVWGHPSLEIFHLVSAPGGAGFECNMVSGPDPGLANWLPNISLAGPYSPVEQPVILYTHGAPGEGCRPTTETEVYCVIVEEVA